MISMLPNEFEGMLPRKKIGFRSKSGSESSDA